MSLDSEGLWQSPDFFITLKAGSEEDHALLMASIFRTVKHEDTTDFAKFTKEERKKLVTKNDKNKEFLKLDGDETTKGEGTPGDDDPTAPKANDEETKMDLLQEDSPVGKKSSAGKKAKEERNETIDDRVFVCIGKTTDGSELR